MMDILIVAITVAVYFTLKYFNHLMIEKGKIPKFLDYRPFNCELCSTFWYSLGVFLTLGLTVDWVFLIGVILAAMDAAAQKIEEKNKTIEIK